MTGTSRQTTKNKSNREIIVVGPSLTGFARVVKAGTQFNSTKPEYNLQLEFDQETDEGQAAIEAITEAHEANLAYERGRRPDQEIIDYGLPLKTIDLKDATANGTKRNPDVFTDGRLKVTAKSIFKPGLFGSLTAGDGGNSDLSGVMTHELPVGSIVKVKLALISYFQDGDEKRGAKAVAGSSVKLQSVKLLKKPVKKVFEEDTSAEVLSFGSDTPTTNTNETFTDTFDESTGIE
jgi:hypothetical protein